MSTGSYTETELQQINEEVWSDPPPGGQEQVSVPCPACGADTRVLISWAGSGNGCGAGVLVINCFGCGREGRIKPAANRCPDFDDQMAEIIDLHQHGQPAFCPTCHTQLRIKDSHTLGALHYSAYCYRGGGMGKLSLQR